MESNPIARKEERFAVDVYRLSPEEICELRVLADELANTFASAEDSEFLHDVRLYTARLPLSLLRGINDFRMDEPESGVLLISGIPVDPLRIGATPTEWQESTASPSTAREDFLMMAVGAHLGDVLGWRTQQSGRLIHDIFPIQRHELEQLGTGSAELLTLHTEDAFHELRGDYVALLCMRNPEGVATNLASLNDIRLTDKIRETLFRRLYTIRPDESHQRKTEIDGATAAPNSFAQIEQLSRQPEMISVLFGDPQSPYVRLDPYFMDPPSDPEAKQALAELVSQLELHAKPIVLQPGDLLLVDNYRALHGRCSFTANYDGTDRWLRRVNIARDLRKSIDSRASIASRVIE